MNHSGMDHSGMGHSGMDHSGMDHSGMDHSGMDHSGMDHSGMDHSGVDHSGMDHSVMNHSVMDHSMHAAGSDHSLLAGHDGHDTGDSNSLHGMMSMSFHFGYTNEVVLFDWWKINTIGALIGSMIGIFVLAMVYEGLKYWREHLMRKAIAKQQYMANQAKATCGEENKQLQYMEQILMPPRVNMLSLDHVIQTLLHMLQMIVSYFLMLIFMTYNVWLCIATVLGAGLGYFLFGWRKSVVVDITEHCH